MCDYQYTSVSFIKLRIESKNRFVSVNRIELFFPESECSSKNCSYRCALHMAMHINSECSTRNYHNIHYYPFIITGLILSNVVIVNCYKVHTFT